MIPYVELIDKTSLKQYALIEPTECWFELDYYEAKEFQIDCRATKENLAAVKKGQYVKIPNRPYIWIIVSVEYTYDAHGTRKISAKGYDAKWLLKKRLTLAYDELPYELPNDIASAVYKLVNRNLGSEASDARKIPNFNVELSSTTETIESTQATRTNLLEFVNNLLKTYKYGSIVTFEGGAFHYRIFKGNDKRESVKFSQSFDNLLSSRYYTNDENQATYALVVSKIDDIDYQEQYHTGKNGLDRSEILIESNLSTKYTDENGEEKEVAPTSNKYKQWQQEEGKTKLTEHITVEEVSGEIDIENSIYQFESDFFLGDIVGIQDEYFNLYSTARILKITIKQDAKGYGEEIDYEADS